MSWIFSHFHRYYCSSKNWWIAWKSHTRPWFWITLLSNMMFVFLQLLCAIFSNVDSFEKKTEKILISIQFLFFCIFHWETFNEPPQSFETVGITGALEIKKFKMADPIWWIQHAKIEIQFNPLEQNFWVNVIMPSDPNDRSDPLESS